MISSKVFLVISKCKNSFSIFLFFEDLGTNQIGSNDLEFTDDLIALEFASHFGGFFTLFDCGLDRLKSVPVQSHNGFDLSAIWRRFLKLLAKLEFQLHAFQHSGGLEAEGLGIRVISDLKMRKRKCKQSKSERNNAKTLPRVLG